MKFSNWPLELYKKFPFDSSRNWPQTKSTIQWINSTRIWHYYDLWLHWCPKQQKCYTHIGWHYLKAILYNTFRVWPNYLSLPRNPESNIWPFQRFLKIHPITFNNSMVVSIVAMLVDNTFHLQPCQLHSVPVVNTLLNKTT